MTETHSDLKLALAVPGGNCYWFNPWEGKEGDHPLTPLADLPDGIYEATFQGEVTWLHGPFDSHDDAIESFGYAETAYGIIVRRSPLGFTVLSDEVNEFFVGEDV